MEQILRESGEGAVTRVERVDPATGRKYFCGEFATNIVNRRFCAERFGGGDYILETRVPTKTGGTKYGNRVRFSIDPSVRPATPTPAPTPGAAPAGGSSSMADLLVAQQLENLQTYHRLNMELVERSRGGRMDWAPFVPIGLALINGLFAKSGGQDPVELSLKLLRELKPEARERAGLSEILEQLEVMETLRDKLGGDKKGDNVLATVNRGLGIAERFADRIVSARGNRGPVAGGPRAIAAPAPATDAPASDSPAAPASEEALDMDSSAVVMIKREGAWARELEGRLPEIPQLSQFVPPDAAAAIVYENMTDEALASLEAELGQLKSDETPATWAAAVRQDLEGVSWSLPVRSWFTTALEDLAHRVLEGIQEGGDQPPAGGG